MGVEADEAGIVQVALRMQTSGEPELAQDAWTPRRLWKGAVLATIAHAMRVSTNPLFAYELSWDGINYSRQDSQGTRGTVTFAEDAVVAVFRDDNSERLLEHRRTEEIYDLDRFFTGIPEDLRLLVANEALQYMLDEYNDRVAPVITAAFWGRGDELVAAEPWAEVLEHGARLVRRELSEPEVAIGEWVSDCRMTAGQISLLCDLYERKVDSMHSDITLGEHEYAVLTEQGDRGIVESRKLLADIGILLPDQSKDGFLDSSLRSE